MINVISSLIKSANKNRQNAISDKKFQSQEEILINNQIYKNIRKLVTVMNLFNELINRLISLRKKIIKLKDKSI